MKVSVDTVLGVGYIAIQPGVHVAKTVEYDDNVVVDLDEFGMVVGIEVLDLAASTPLEDVARQFHIASDSLAEMKRAVAGSNSAVVSAAGAGSTITVADGRWICPA